MLCLLCFSISAHIVGQVRQQVPPAHVERHSGTLERPEALEGCVDLLLHPGLQLPQLHARQTPLSGPRAQRLHLQEMASWLRGTAGHASTVTLPDDHTNLPLDASAAAAHLEISLLNSTQHPLGS